VYPSAPPVGHLREEGFEAFQFYGVANSFIRNVHIYNADEAFHVWNGAFITVKDVHILATREPVACAAERCSCTPDCMHMNHLYMCTCTRSWARQLD
jgi:hypothetical protein